MRIISLLFIGIIIMSVFVLADVDDELSVCGNDVRCKFKLASEQMDETSCESLEGELYEKCREKLGLEIKPKSERFVLKTADYINQSLNPTKTKTHKIGTALVSIAFVFMILLLFLGKYKHVFFIKNHKDLVDYITKSLKKDIGVEQIKFKLKKTGWNDEVIKKAIKEAKIKK